MSDSIEDIARRRFAEIERSPLVSHPCPICDTMLKFNSRGFSVDCGGCNTNLWIEDLLTKDPKECGVTW